VAVAALCFLEAYVAVLVAGQIGPAATAALLVACSIAGLWLARHEGARAWLRLQDAVRERRSPGPAITDGALLLVGGLLLAFPGFVTDALGLLVVLPLTRPAVRRLVIGLARRRLPPGVRPVVRRGARRADRGREDAAPDRKVIEGEVVDDIWDER
jgi:UPF0716 protein FxsA